jgi:hypothetical protein
MAAQENLYDLEVIQTDTKTWKLTVSTEGVAIDVSGYLLFFTVKNSLTDEDTSALIKATITCPSNAESQAGICYIPLSSTDTNITAGTYVFDIKLQYNEGATIVRRDTILTGRFSVNRTATKRTS